MGIDGTKTLRSRLSVLSSVLAGMTPPFPALDVLRSDVATAQSWLDKTLAQLQGLDITNTGRPPDPKKRKKNVEKLKVSNNIS